MTQGPELRLRLGVPPDCPLSPSEFSILCRLADGARLREIAVERDTTYSTVRTHLLNAYRRLEVTDRAQAVAMMGRKGWIGWRPPDMPDDPRPLALTHPFLGAYLNAFDRWIASRCQDQVARKSMDLALHGARNDAGQEQAA